MSKCWMLGVVAVVLSMGNVGCYLDQLKAEQRANRALQEQLADAQQDLQDSQLMLRQKDTTIDSLQNQLDAKNDQIASLQAEADHLRQALDKAHGILAKNAEGGPGETIVVTQKLPDALHKSLKELAEKYPTALTYDPARGAVRWKADLLFPLGSDQLQGATDSLREFAEIVNSSAAAGFDVVIVGHTCTTPIKKAETLAQHKTNWHLSAHRSIAVMELLGGCSVGMDRMGVMGYGEYRPIADNASTDGKAKNRRVEIFLVQKESIQAVGSGIYEAKGLGIAFVTPKSADELGR